MDTMATSAGPKPVRLWMKPARKITETTRSTRSWDPTWKRP